jgi:hypothetical protein
MISEKKLKLLYRMKKNNELEKEKTKILKEYLQVKKVQKQKQNES